MIIHTRCMSPVAPTLALNLIVGITEGRIQITKTGIGDQRTACFQGINDYIASCCYFFHANNSIML